MNKFTLLGVSLMTASVMFAQNLPENPEPGKCYVRCTTPDVYVNEEVRIETRPAYKKLRVIPAKYETRTERVVIKEATKRLKVVPAKWGTETVSYEKREGASKLSIVPASFRDDTETIEIKPSYTAWELGAPAPDCASPNPEDCRYWCFKEYPAEFTSIPVSKLIQDATIQKASITGNTGT